MSIPLVQPPRPPVTVVQQSYISHSDHASIGPFIAVLVVIIILGIVAVMIGRLCTGKKIMTGYGQYDIESWIETKCASCIDGRIIPPPERTADASSGVSLQVQASAPPQSQ
ncbi:hypothetical protein SLEP1_g16817 [Rubroshorea leprosula]|uniref:Uncharacterized protein n=1 Tax=Rubroshorea leprosula TaxID=152421 RepID=A0AAV5IS38_9ROSI|nr:hypothetical protein SLEP1_g16817 [Rubroshorea leprosula]